MRNPWWLIVPATLLALVVFDLAVTPTVASVVEAPPVPPVPQAAVPSTTIVSSVEADRVIRRIYARVVAQRRTTSPDVGDAVAEPPEGLPKPPPRPWQPFDECRRISGFTWRVMRWCPYTADALHEGVRRGAWEWQPGELRRFMALYACESGGDPKAKNPRSTASGLGQFLDGTWAKWAPLAARFFGFDHPQVFMPYDNILATVYLAKTDGWQHWRCWR